VAKIFADVLLAEKDGVPYDPNAGLLARERAFKVNDGSEEAGIIISVVEAGAGITEATTLVNEHRASRAAGPDADPISWNAVRNWIAANPAIKIDRRAKKKSGSDDKGTAWAKARLAQAEQIKAQLAIVGTEGLPRLYLDGIAWWDEFHMKVRLGNSSKNETRVARHPETGLVCDPDDGGVFPPKMPITSMKYPGEARVCAGACMYKVPEGTPGRYEGFKGVTLSVYDYTGKQVVGVKAYEKACAAELARVMNMKGCWLNKGGYKGRYPETWKEELDLVVKKTLCPITDIMDHVVRESTAAYAGTNHAADFMIFHDGLSAWWEVEAQAHMATLGFKDRQIKNITANLGTRYAGKIVGDSPEMCRALDSHGFADLKAAIYKYASLTSVCPLGDPRRFNLGTPAEVLRCIKRAFAVAPSSKRIVEDILVMGLVLDKIIAAEGCVVPDEDMRHGRRARRRVDVNQASRRGAEAQSPRTPAQGENHAHGPGQSWC
jgi:hypothetical protein